MDEVKEIKPVVSMPADIFNDLLSINPQMSLQEALRTGLIVKTGIPTRGNFSSLEKDNGSVTGTATINWADGNVQYITLTGNTTLTFTNPLSGMRCILHVAGAYTPTFPASVRWTSDTTPTATATSGKKDIYTFVYCSTESLYDGLQSPNYSIT